MARDLPSSLTPLAAAHLCPRPTVGWVDQWSSLWSDWVDRLVVITVDRCDIASAAARLKVVLAHEAFDFLVIDEHALLSQVGAHPPPAVTFKLFADRRDRFDDCGVVGGRRGAVVGRAGNSLSRHPSATDRPAGRQSRMKARLCAAVRFSEPPLKLQLQRLLADEAFEGGDPRFVLLDQISGDCVFVERAGLETLDPDVNQIARSA